MKMNNIIKGGEKFFNALSFAGLTPQQAHEFRMKQQSIEAENRYRQWQMEMKQKEFGQKERELELSLMPDAVLTVNPMTGVGRPAVDPLGRPLYAKKGARIVSSTVPTAEKITMESGLETMDGLLNDLEAKLTNDPEVLIRGINPFAEREFKAIVDSFDKSAAIAAGGKQLTKTELDLIRKTRPGLLDANSPKAIKYKLDTLRKTIKKAKARLISGQEIPTGEETKNQTSDEYEKYLQAIGAK